MAFNSWDKLAKAQNDYPKPKFALAVVDKALKKSPKNPFLLTWRVDLSLQQNSDPKLALDRLKQVSQGEGLTDSRLLSYLYRLSIEATRRGLSSPSNTSSVGTEFLKPWQTAVKTIERRNDRLQLWDALFNTAMREGCWEDVRFAVVNYNKEAQISKKQAHFTLILALELAASQKDIGSSANDPMARMQHTLARKMLKQAYEASKDDPIAVKDIRDLRFMADVYGRQAQSEELFALWANPPATLQGLMRTHEDDLLSIKTRMLRKQQHWSLLEAHCRDCITKALSNPEQAQNSKSLWELCAWKWELWEALLTSIENTYSREEAIEQVSGIMEQCFGTGTEIKDRPVRLTYLHIRKFIGTLTVSDCKGYWEHHSALSSCFTDLRPLLEALPTSHLKEFCQFIQDHAKAVGSRVDTKKAAFEDWQVAELNCLKFSYLLTISSPRDPSHEALEAFIVKTLDFCSQFPEVADGGFLAIYALLHLHHQIMCGYNTPIASENKQNSRILLQATMLALHLTDASKDNRTLCLLAARLHLNLGLGQSAFELYRHARCKEMLLDTLSPYIFSRISLTHPFDIKGYHPFSADEELSKAIGTIEKMEKKADSFIYIEMPSFLWDQASDALDLKRRLKLSLTKHICTLERYRIARLKGESTEGLPQLDCATYPSISNNLDTSVFPNFEATEMLHGPLSLVMPNEVPNVSWLFASHCDWETISRALHKEGEIQNFEPWRADGTLQAMESNQIQANKTLAETQLEHVWKYIRILTHETFSPNTLYKGDQKRNHTEDLRAVIEEIKTLRGAMEKLNLSGVPRCEPENEPTMFHENMLISCYTKLEVLRAVTKLVEHMEKARVPKSTHVLKAKLPQKDISELTSETHKCFDAIRDVAQSYVNLIRTRGEVAIKAQVGWGETGKALMKLMDKESVEKYAREYVQSALEAWNGVLKVKLK